MRRETGRLKRIKVFTLKLAVCGLLLELPSMAVLAWLNLDIWNCKSTNGNRHASGAGQSNRRI